ncbi:katG1 [Symbiodinium sp. CCMP2456]|nr:katG1 [Symbiodinium sp. CCMP2456]
MASSDEAKPRRTTCDESAQAIRKYLDELRLEVEKLEAQVAELQEEALPKSSETGAVRLNVGGDTGFELFREQFDCFPKSLLHSIVTGRWGGYTSLDDDGRIFLDLDPAQFRCVLDWAFAGGRVMFVENLMCRRRIGTPPCAGDLGAADLLLRFLGLAEDPATIVGEPKVKLDPEDGAICTYTEILCKYAKEFSTDEIRDYWLNCMESVRNAMPCYRPVMMCNGMPVRDQLTSQQSSQIDELACLLADHIRAVQEEGQELHQRRSAAQDQLEKLETERTGIRLLGGRAATSQSSSEVQQPEVYFNAAGRILATSRATLLHCTGSMLERWFGGDWTLQESDLVGNAVRIDQDSETFASVLQILRYHRIFGPSSGLPAGQPCRKAKLPALRQALSYFQLEQVKGNGKGFKGKASRSASAWLRPESSPGYASNP